jgi:signal transduction histidine kinase
MWPMPDTPAERTGAKMGSEHPLETYRAYLKELAQGRFGSHPPARDDPALADLSQDLADLGTQLQRRQQEGDQIEALLIGINGGWTLEEVLNQAFVSFRRLIPYDRIGCALLDAKREVLTARWARLDYSEACLTPGYSARIAGSSLEPLLSTQRPRILNDLEAYLQSHPQSESTQLAVAEGVRSSLTCPLAADSVPLGFLFFSSRQRGTYASAHVEVYQRIARQVSIAVERALRIAQLSEQKEAIEVQNRELRKLDGVKNRVLGMVAHDLRNPIANVQAVAELLLEPENGLTEEQRHLFITDLRDQARYMLPLLEDLLDVTRIEATQLKLNRRELDLAGLVSDAVRRHGLMAEPKGTHLSQAVPEAATVWADPVRLRQVLDNFLSNAIKFSPPGSTVQVQIAPDEAGWRVSVTDQGPGLTEEDRKGLFQAFARLSAKPTGDEKSTGLGLAIAKRVIEAHGGTVGADSSPGSGATFWFSLPAKPSQTAQTPHAHEPEPA